MKVLLILILMLLMFGLLRFAQQLIKELAEFASEAWHQGELEP